LGTATRGFLRSLRASGLGVVLAVDVEAPRDHARARAMRLTHLELEVPPFEGRLLRQLLAQQLAARTLPHELTDPDRAALVEVALGRPGWIVMLAERLADRQYWSRGHVFTELLRADVSIAVAARYGRPGGTGEDVAAGLGAP
jgi:hypothetical protein